MTYKVIYYEGESIDLLTPARVGRLSLAGGQLSIEGDSSVSIRLESILDVELNRFHLARMIKIQHRGGILFVATVRFAFFGFVMGNYFATGRLNKELQAIVLVNRSG